MRSLRALLLLMVVATAGVPAAQALDIDASVDTERPSVGAQVILTVVVSGTFRNIEPPVLPDLGGDFQIYEGGTSRNFSFINGKASSSVSYRYVLIPRKAGRFVLDPIAVTHKDATVRTRPITLVVSASNVPPPPAGESDQGSVVAGNEDLFVRASVDKPEPYLFEQVTYRILLYTRLGLLDNPTFSPPSTEGFWKEDLPPRNPRMATIEGRRYQVMEVDIALFPTTPGELTIGAAVLECRVRSQQQSRDPFSMFGGRFFGGKPVRLTTDPITIQVKPLPPGAPPGFEGAVGDYVLELTTDRVSVPQNEPVQVSLKISGNGNLRTLGDVAFPDLPDFRAYPEKSAQTPSRTGLTLGGSIQQDFVLVPLSTGKKTIPAIEVVSFSPRSGSYKMLTTRPVTIDVTPATQASAEIPAGRRRSDIELVGRDIRFIETDLPAFQPVSLGAGGLLRWLLFLPAPMLGYAGVWIWDRRRRRLGGDVALQRRSRAAKHARARLKNAAAGDPALRAEAAAEAVRGYCGDRWNLATAGLTGDRLRETLGSTGVQTGELIAFLETCDAVRFAPGLTPKDGDLLGTARDWIDRLEKSR